MILPYCIQVLQNMLTRKGVFPAGLSEKINTTTQQLPTQGFKLALGSDIFKNATGVHRYAYILITVQEKFMLQ